MPRAALALLPLVALLLLVACGDGGDPAPASTPGDDAPAATATEAPVDPTPIDDATPAETTGAAPADTPAPTEPEQQVSEQLPKVYFISTDW